MQSMTRLNTYGNSNTITAKRGKSMNTPKYIYNRPTYITLSDFMRIQNEINPINAEYENRKAYEEKLKKLSLAKSKNWADSLEMKKKSEFELAKKRFLEDEERRRRIDEEEKKYLDTQNDLIAQRAKQLLFEEQDPVKSFNSKLLYCDILKERDYQKDNNIEELIPKTKYQKITGDLSINTNSMNSNSKYIILNKSKKAHEKSIEIQKEKLITDEVINNRNYSRKKIEQNNNRQILIDINVKRS